MSRVPVFTYRWDQVDANTLYLGTCRLDQLDEASPVWQILRFLTIGTVTSVDYAENNSASNKIWNNRASYTYGV